MDIKPTGLVNLIQLGTAGKAQQGVQVSEAPKAKKSAPELKVIREPEPSNLSDHKAVFALHNKHVVIQFLDKDGEVVKQIPPKELISAYERLQETIKNQYDNEA